MRTPMRQQILNQYFGHKYLLEAYQKHDNPTFKKIADQNRPCSTYSTCSYMQIYTYIYTCIIYTYTHIDKQYPYIQYHINKYTYTYVYTYMYIYLSVYIYIYIHNIYIYICISICKYENDLALRAHAPCSPLGSP